MIYNRKIRRAPQVKISPGYRLEDGLSSARLHQSLFKIKSHDRHSYRCQKCIAGKFDSSPYSRFPDVARIVRHGFIVLFLKSIGYRAGNDTA